MLLTQLADRKKNYVRHGTFGQIEELITMFTPPSRVFPKLLVAPTALLVIAGCGGAKDSDASGGGSTATASTSTPAPASGGSVCDSGDASNPDDPCIISTVEPLQAIGENRESKCGHYALGGDIDASATREWGVDDEDEDGVGFKPIRGLTGSLDGRGHAISGLYIDRPDPYALTGMFASSGEGSGVRDLRLSDFKITTKSSAGLLVGQASGVIRDVHAHGELNGDDRTGGLVGTLKEEGMIVNSSTTGTVNASGERVGGLVGQNYGTIRSSFSLSAVHGRSEVGGLVGRSEGTVEQSYSLVGSPDAPEEESEGHGYGHASSWAHRRNRE